MKTDIQNEMEDLAKTMSKKFLHRFWGKKYVGKNKRVKGYCSHCGITILLVKMGNVEGSSYSLFLDNHHFRVTSSELLAVTNHWLHRTIPFSRTIMRDHICKKYISML